MSNYNIKAKNKKTGAVNLFTVHKYYDGEWNESPLFEEDEFNEHYEVIEDPNHPYGGMEVLDNVPCECEEMTCQEDCTKKHTHKTFYCDKCCLKPITGNNTWEDKFNMEFVDEDTGLLNIGKYDHERIINFFNNLHK